MTHQIELTAPAGRHAKECFATFREQIEASLADKTLPSDVIGKGMLIDGPDGPVRLIYADYAASGRALRQVEQFVLENVLPVYANPHTMASYCGRAINTLRRAARQEIAAYCGANVDDAVIFAGSGATAGIQKLVRLFGADRPDPSGRMPLVLLGPYEHHSNLLPWRESGAEIVELPEDPQGGPDRELLLRYLTLAGDRRVICSFSAGSNITGALTDVVAVSRLVKAEGGFVIWDYAGAAPYMPMSMRPAEDLHIDAMVFSPHKFIGGPGASGVLVVRRDAIVLDKPSAPGGGTVSFVSPDTQDYVGTVEAREEAGTPNAIGDIRAALSIIVRDCLAKSGADARTAQKCQKAIEFWSKNPHIEILGTPRDDMLPIVSFRVRDSQGELVHHQLVTRILSDKFGIQARGGCACAGPYVHHLLDIDDDGSQAIRRAISEGKELEKPGFVRVNFSALMDAQEFDLVVEAVDRVARESENFSPQFIADPATAIFEPLRTAPFDRFAAMGCTNPS